MFEINQLLKATGGRLIAGAKSVPVKGISIDTRTIKPGEVFVAIRGDNFDGHDFIAAAIKNKASLIISESKKTKNPDPVPSILGTGAGRDFNNYPKGMD